MSGAISFLIFVAGMAVLVAAIALWRAREVTTIYPPMVGLLYRDGRFERELPPGRHSRFDPLGRSKIVQVSLAELPVQLGETTVLSKDQFSFRLTFAPVVRVVDARLFAESQSAMEQYAMIDYMPAIAAHAALHPLLAAAAMEAVGSATLAEILADQKLVTDAVQAKLTGAVPGAAVDRVLLTSINLPPETRRMFTDVERARMEGLAALEKARSEQAALRVLANAARLVKDNPELANLRLLQAIESSKGSTTIVLGNPAAPLTGLAAPPASAASG